MKGDKDDGEFVLGGPTAGAKRASDGGAASTAKLAMSTTADRMKEIGIELLFSRVYDPEVW